MKDRIISFLIGVYFFVVGITALLAMVGIGIGISMVVAPDQPLPIIIAFFVGAIATGLVSAFHEDFHDD